MDFQNNWIDMLKYQLENMGYEPSSNRQDICFKYFNLQKRLIAPHPRKILISKEFTYPKEFENGLELIKSKIEKGTNLKHHLSSLISNLDYNDQFLNDWGIHHLHLGTELNGNFVNRTGPVLFVRFDDNYAYFINVFNHGKSARKTPWYRQEMIAIIHRNWPDSINQFVLKGINNINPIPTDSDIKNSRKHNSMSLIKVDGVAYAPIGMGYAASGHSIEAHRICDIYYESINHYEKWIRENPGMLIKEANKRGINIGNNIHLLLGIKNNDLYALEVYSRVFFRIGSLS
ncbi:hypothetical protein JFV29_14120 [Peribacillus sp. TH16]|uniref:hypothetical protein n=1 Tax=Peribacillus sp. TH16 TaxID=2798482 RepID=UPI0019126925|nr:hypothetical protein [Peribacillus sp. TH16]MBK5482983.1 hypothetical protein [Peribacillus sp. TH16]MBK5483007.1 hypothetical protein [Peribacillus sp. TH16]